MDIEALLARMTLDEKLAQMSQYGTSCLSKTAGDDVTGPARDLSLTKADVASVGSTLGSGCAADVIALQKAHLDEDPNGIPLLFMRDVIHGWRTIYPIPLGMGATWDTDLVYRCCRMAAKEAAVAGINVTFSPMVDLARDCRWGRDMETTGEDPYLNSRMAETMVKGYQGDLTGEYDIAACVKHFAGYGGAESGRDYNTVELSEHTLRESYLPAYRAAVDAGVKMVMTSFNTLGGIPSAGNRRLVHDLLREEWGFGGAVISDWNSFGEMLTHGYAEDARDAAEKALNAGNDIEMMSTCYLRHGKELVENGTVTMEQVDEAVRRILTLKNELGLFEHPYGVASPEKEKEFFLSDAHRALCRAAAVESAVLLKNDGVLPLDPALPSIAAIGPYADAGMIGSWACEGRAAEAVTVAGGLRAAVPHARVDVLPGCSGALDAESDEEMLSAAVSASKNASAVVLCLGEASAMSGEGNSRADVALPFAQKELLRRVAAVNPRTVVLLFSGRPLALGDVIDDAPAFVAMWQPGTEGGNAAADLLFGRENFSGRLTMTFPRTVGQAPIYYNHMNTGRPQANDADRTRPFHSRYLDVPNSPLFPFGYGLSYTTFAFGAVALSADRMERGGELTASATIRNTGARRGTTVAQLYIRDRVASCVRPVRELRDFARVTLEPGEEKTVSFRLTEDTLAFHTASGRYEAEPGTFDLFISENAGAGDPVSFTLR